MYLNLNYIDPLLNRSIPEHISNIPNELNLYSFPGLKLQVYFTESVKLRQTGLFNIYSENRII